MSQIVIQPSHSSSDMKQFLATCFAVNKVKTFLPVNIWYMDKKKADGTIKKEKCVANSKSSLQYENFVELHEKKETRIKNKHGEESVYYIGKSNTKNKDKIIDYMNCSNYEVSLRANKSIYCIDIDDTNITWEQLPECLKGLPYTLSSSKGLWHFWFQIEGIDHETLKSGTGELSLGSDNLNFAVGELLISHTWERANGKVYNWDLNRNLPLLSWDIVRTMCKEEAINKVLATQKQVNTISFSVVEPDDTTSEESLSEDQEETDTYSSGTCFLKLPKKEKVVVKEKEEETKVEPKVDLKEKEKMEIRIRLLQPLWKKDKLDSWDNWRDFTWIIQNTFEGDTGVDIWDEISKKYGKYSNSDNLKKWNELKKTQKSEGKKKTIGTLAFWAKSDSPEEYEQMFNKEGIEWDRLTEYTFAKRLKTKEYLGNNILFTGSTKNMNGFKFNGVYWEDLGDHNSEIKKGYFDKMYNFYMKELEKVESFFDPDVVFSFKCKIKSLDSAVFRNHVIEILKTENYIKDVKWNKDNNLFAFDDCIYNLKIGAFVKPDPKQYINWTTGYSYGDTKNEYLEQQTWCKTFLSQILNNPSTENWILKVLASFLKQENAEEKCHFWLGEGRNGKGTLTTLLKIALGKYFGELNLGYYTQYDKSADAPNNNLYNLRYARLINTSEVGEDNTDPEKPMRFLTEKFKRITGGDTLVARQPHEKVQVEFKGGKTLVQTNLMPELVGIEQPKNISLRERVCITTFPFSFIEDGDPLLLSNPQKYKKKDISIKETMNDEKIKLGFIRLLLNTYKLYLSEGIVEPPQIKQNKLNYFDECNKTKSWFQEYLEPTEDINKNEYRINIPSDLYIQFCSNSVSTKKISKAVFTRHLTDLLGKISAKDSSKCGVFTLNGVAWVQGYKWKSQTESSGCFLKLPNHNDNDLDIESETEEEEPCYELA
jgi:phage/plasmid-associated DNA primase